MGMRLLLAICLLTKASAASALTCSKISLKEFEAKRPSWKGRELLAVASWCSSCKQKVLADDHGKPHVLLVAFDDAAAVEKTLTKLAVTGECIAGEDIVESLGVPSLPWSMQL